MWLRDRFKVTSLAVLVWGGLAIGLAVHAALYPWSHTVYDIYALAGHNWLAGNDLYVGGRDYYRYSPLFAVLVAPFSLLSAHLGTPLWKVFSLGFYGLSAWTWARRCLPARLGRDQVAAFLLLALAPALHSIYNGQANVIMIGACLLGTAAAAGERWNAAAAWLALATLIKAYPLALVLLLAALYTRRFAARYAAAVALGLVLPFLPRPGLLIPENASWFHHLGESTVLMRGRLRSIDYLLWLYNHPISPRTFAVLEVLAGGAVLLLCLWHARQTTSSRERLTQVFLLFAAWAVLFGPATESCTYAVMAPAAAWKVVDVFRRPAAWTARLLLVACLLMVGPLVTDLFGSTVRNFASDHGSQPIGALLFLAYLVAEMWQNGRRAAVPGESPLPQPGHDPRVVSAA